MDILASHNIKMSVGGCGCCGSPWVRFEYEGVSIAYDGLSKSPIKAEDGFEFDMFKEE